MNVEGILSMTYETQHFGFHPKTFVDEIYNTFYENTFEALHEMQKYLSDEFSNVTTTEAIKTSTEALLQQLTKQLDKAIDKLELFIDSNILIIPKHVILPEDGVHATYSSTKEDEEKLDEEIRQLRQEILQERIRKSFIKSKIIEQKQVKDDLLTFKMHLDQLSSSVLQTKFDKESIQITLENCLNLCREMKQSPKNLLNPGDLS